MQAWYLLQINTWNHIHIMRIKIIKEVFTILYSNKIHNRVFLHKNSSAALFYPLFSSYHWVFIQAEKKTKIPLFTGHWSYTIYGICSKPRNRNTISTIRTHRLILMTRSAWVISLMLISCSRNKWSEDHVLLGDPQSWMKSSYIDPLTTT